MADYITNTNELTSIANAIRTKGGTSENLTYPGGFIQAISDIVTGGGESEGAGGGESEGGWEDISDSFTITGTYNYFKASYNESLAIVQFFALCDVVEEENVPVPTITEIEVPFAYAPVSLRETPGFATEVILKMIEFDYDCTWDYPEQLYPTSYDMTAPMETEGNPINRVYFSVSGFYDSAGHYSPNQFPDPEILKPRSSTLVIFGCYPLWSIDPAYPGGY